MRALVAWCETHHEFCGLRLERMQQLRTVEGPAGVFMNEPGKSLSDYLRSAAPAHVPQQLTGGS